MPNPFDPVCFVCSAQNDTVHACEIRLHGIILIPDSATVYEKEQLVMVQVCGGCWGNVELANIAPNKRA